MQPGERIKFFRKQKRLTQIDFGQNLGFSHGYISDLERNRQEPSRDFLKKLNEVFGVSSDYILYGRPEDQEGRPSEKTPGMYDQAKETMIVREPEMRYPALPPATKKILDSVLEILNSKNEVMIDALKSNIKAFLTAIKSIKEKRGVGRVSINIPAVIKILDKPETHSVIILNASLLGLLIQGSCQMNIGEKVAFELSFPERMSLGSFVMKTEVIRKEVKLIDHNESCQYGMRFVEISEDGYSRLESLLYDFKKGGD